MPRGLVRFHAGVLGADKTQQTVEANAVLNKYGANWLERISNRAVVADVPTTQALLQIRDDLAVEEADPEPTEEATLDEVSLGVGLSVDEIGIADYSQPDAILLELEAAHQITRGAGVRMLNLDTGYHKAHQFQKLAVAEFDVTTGASEAVDLNKHGSHTCGTMQAQGGNSFGMIGGAPDADLLVGKVFPGSSGSTSWTNIGKGMAWGMEQGLIDVVSMSFGGTSHPGAVLEKEFADARATGALLFASAGNSGSGADRIGFPAKFDSCLAIAACDNLKRRASFSSEGPANFTIWPGVAVISLSHTNTTGFLPLSGTSMACPWAASIYALYRSAGGDPDEFVATVEQWAEDLGSPGHDNLYGWGLGNALRILEGAEPPFGTPTWFVDQSIQGSRRLVSRTCDLGDGSGPFEAPLGETVLRRAKIGGALTTTQTVTDSANRTSTSTKVVNVPEPPPEEGPTSFHDVLLAPPPDGGTPPPAAPT